VTHYQTLELANTATQEEIRTAYKRLALLHHPDKNPGKSDERFKAINEANEVLSDPGKRRAYDQELQRGSSNPGGDQSSDDENGNEEDLLAELRRFFGEYTEMMSQRAEPAVASEARRLHERARGNQAPFLRACTNCHADLPLLREVLTHMISTPQVETYTDLFRCDASSLRTVSKPVRAIQSRGVRVYVYRHGLLSNDADGEPLGYQTPQSPINGRAPFFLEVQVCPPDKKWIRVPVISFHAPYGQSAKDKKKKKKKATPDDGEELPPLGRPRDEPLDEDLLAMRSEAVQKLLQLGIPDYTGGPPRPLQDFDDAVIAGDFNLDMMKERRSRHISEAYQALRKQGFREMIRNTPTTLRTVDTCLPARNEPSLPEHPDWYSAAYDNIFVKQKDLELCPTLIEANPLVAGVVDVFDVMTRHQDEFFNDQTVQRIGNPANYHATEKYPAPKNLGDLDGPAIRARNETARYLQTGDRLREKAFFLYRKYISDHLPVFVDFFVAATSDDGADEPAVRGPRRPPRPLIGLRNEGSTCYLSAALQLMHAMGYLAHYGSRLDKQPGFAASLDELLAFAVLRVLRGLTSQAAGGNYLSNTNRLPKVQTAEERLWLDGTTRAIRDNLLVRGLINQLSGVNEDAGSVFATFRSVLVDKPRAKVASGELKEFFAKGGPGAPELPSRYHFVLRAAVKYKDLHKIPKPPREPTLIEDGVLIKYDAMDCLELSIPAKAQKPSLEQLVAAYMHRDMRADKGTEANCSRIGTEGKLDYFYGKPEQEDSALVGNAPEELLVRLKRFAWDNGGQKLNEEVICNDRVVVFNRSYFLRGFIYHDGADVASGHYIAYVRRGDDWYELNDVRVIPNPPALQQRRNLAYVYWYVSTPEMDELSDLLSDNWKFKD
jgi:hypothetical protein